MAPRGSLLLLALLLLSCALPRGRGQHWSHGWYPGGKRDLGIPTNLQVPSPFGRCRPLPTRWWGWTTVGQGGGAGSAMGQFWENLLCSQARSSVPSPAPGRAEFRAEVLQKTREERLAAEGSVEELEEHRRLMAWNDEENARQRARREERLRKEEEKQKRRKLEIAEKRARKMEAFLEEKEKEVLQLQEEAKNFITPENLEARIEECLDNPRNYNFAIDKDGRIVKRTVLS
ncbi:PREDICTED: 28S ribosomal protein S26, mitochondrial [Corvus brachyrhynchos]|nr:PREDICTED: 28S ribosomal protein S26, mitochondrial [Corvus brachyrhynchos]